MSEYDKRRQDAAANGGGPFVPPPPGPPTRGGPNSAPPPNSSYGYHGHHHHGHSSSFSPSTGHNQKMKHSMPPNGIPPVTPPHMPSQQHHLRQAPSSVSSHYMSPQHYAHHANGGGRGGGGGASGAGGHGGSFVPYNRHPVEHHEARGHHHRHGPHVSRSASDEEPPATSTPKIAKKDFVEGSAAADAPSASANGPSTFADFEPPRSDASSHKRQSRHDNEDNSAGQDSTRAPTSPPENKKQRTLAPSTSKDGGPNLSPTLTFADRCDSFRGAIAGTGVGLPTGMSFGMPGQDAQILQSWSAGSLGMGMGRPNSPSDIQVCYEGWNHGAIGGSGGPPPPPGAAAPGPSHLRSPNGSQAMMPSRSSWDEPIPLGSASMMEFDNANGGRRWPLTPGAAPMRQGSFGPPPLQQQSRDARFGFSRGMSMSGEFQSGAGAPSGQYNKTPNHTGHPGGQQLFPGAGASWFDSAASFPSPHGRQMSQQRRDEMDQLSSPRGGWSRDYVPPRSQSGSYGYHQSPPRPFPQMHGMRHDDSRRDPSPPYMISSQQQRQHHASFAGNKLAIHSHAGQLRTPDGVLLLAMPDDRISLSETLCVVRENVEVFCATEADVKAPAPGRKRPVTVGQIGLRCIHCRNATNPGDRVKRAICFPSSIKRIYRTVIDMKLDHFKACRYVPAELKTRLAELKATNGRSTGTTMQYFVSAAKKMGMTDGPNGMGVRYDPSLMAGAQSNPAIIKQDSHSPGQPHRSQHRPRSNTLALTHSHMSFDRQIGLSSSSGSGMGHSHHRMHPGVPSGPMLLSGSGSSLSMGSFAAGADGAIKLKGSEDLSVDSNTEFFFGKVSLSMPEDKTSLSPLRCFLRENVIAFSATAEDIAVRTPTTFSVVEGQVGIGCVHCYNLPAKQRSNRAVCFPFSIGRIYQSVADIQRFHFNECKMVPKEVRAKFISLQNASSKGSKGLATRQYWISSAKKLGLADTNKGIRFIRDPDSPAEQPVSLDILAQVASDVTTASKPLVLPEDKPTIAEFLYVVMEQLQPCRFTEADRNKRRLKNLGCIGVECKHCAGKVESRKFFWSSVNAVESNFVSVHTHMMECKFVPEDLKEKLAELKLLRKEHTARLKVGSQKAFFNKVWERLHANEQHQKQQEQKQKAQKPVAAASTGTPKAQKPQLQNKETQCQQQKQQEQEKEKEQQQPQPQQQQQPLQQIKEETPIMEADQIIPV